MDKVYENYVERINSVSGYSYNWTIFHIMDIVNKASKDPDLDVFEWNRLCYYAKAKCDELVM